MGELYCWPVVKDKGFFRGMRAWAVDLFSRGHLLPGIVESPQDRCRKGHQPNHVNHISHPLIPGEEMEPSQEVVPVVEGVFASEQRQPPRPGVLGVHGDVEEALGNPEECHGGRVLLLVDREVHHDSGRDQDLYEAAAQDPDELPEEAEDHMARLMEDEIHPIEEAEGAGTCGRDDPVDADEGDKPGLDGVEAFHTTPFTAGEARRVEAGLCSHEAGAPPIPGEAPPFFARNQGDAAMPCWPTPARSCSCA